MEVIVEGRRALVKAGSSVQYVAENRAFTESDGYTMTIEFPLRGCQENKDVFGHLNRMDVEHGLVRMDAVVRCGVRFARRGVLTVVGGDQDVVKCQFLEGRAAQNFDTTLDKVYINELKLAMPRLDVPTEVVHGWVRYGSIDRTDYVCLPWVNDGSGLLQNAVELETDKVTAKRLSAMPYLLRLTQWVLKAAGYEFDLREWEASRHRHLLCCNVLPAAWRSRDWADALPHWSVAEFLEQLELFLGGDFDVDHVEKRVEFHYRKAWNEGLAVAVLDEVQDDFEVETTEKDDSGFADTKVYKYADRSDDEWKYLSCQDVVDGFQGHYYEFPMWRDFWKALLNGPWSQYGDLRGYTPGLRGYDAAEDYWDKLYRVADSGTYFAMRCVETADTKEQTEAGEPVRTNRNKAQMLNVYGKSRGGDEDAEEVELSIVPARVDMTDHGFALFVPCPSDDQATDSSAASARDDVASPAGGRAGIGRRQAKFSDDFTAEWRQSPAVRTAMGGKTGKTEYFSQMAVAYWDGKDYHNMFNRLYLACPIVDRLTFFDEEDGLEAPMDMPKYSMRLSDRELAYASVERDGHRVSAVDVRTKYTFTFVADRVPDVRSVFAIRGQRYLCAKVTVELGDGGMSRLMKGEFYRIVS